MILAWIPFLEPFSALQPWWWALIAPLSLGISMMYKAIRLPDLGAYWRQVALMTAQVILALIGLALGLAILVEVIIPLLPVR